MDKYTPLTGGTTLEQDLAHACAHIKTLEAAERARLTAAAKATLQAAAAKATAAQEATAKAGSPGGTVTRAEFNKMTPAAQAAHFKTGGTITN
jgi:hypothetical protein